jgi:hypothetical protein
MFITFNCVHTVQAYIGLAEINHFKINLCITTTTTKYYYYEAIVL